MADDRALAPDGRLDWGEALSQGGVVHLCIDMQQMFAAPTAWHAPWLNGVLPAVEALVAREPGRTFFTRFIPPVAAHAAPGAWQDYYRRWRDMTREHLPPELLHLVPALRRHVPPARLFDKPIYSPWLGSDLHAILAAEGTRTLIVSGGETDVCVSATVLGAIDLGYRVILPVDAVFGSADATHDAMMAVYRNRFAVQLATCSAQDVLDHWPER